MLQTLTNFEAAKPIEGDEFSRLTSVKQHNKTVIFVQDIQRHVLGRLRSLLFGNEADAESTGEVLEYFMRRLSSVQTAERDSAVKVHCNVYAIFI